MKHYLAGAAKHIAVAGALFGFELKICPNEQQLGGGQYDGANKECHRIETNSRKGC